MNGQHEFRLTNCVEDAVEYPAWYATNLGHGTHSVKPNSWASRLRTV